MFLILIGRKDFKKKVYCYYSRVMVIVIGVWSIIKYRHFPLWRDVVYSYIIIFGGCLVLFCFLAAPRVMMTFSDLERCFLFLVVALDASCVTHILLRAPYI